MKKFLIMFVVFLVIAAGVITGGSADDEAFGLVSPGDACQPVQAGETINPDKKSSKPPGPKVITQDGLDIAAQIIKVGQDRGFSPAGQILVLSVALTESGFFNNTGGDRDSVGVFQFRTSSGFAEWHANKYLSADGKKYLSDNHGVVWNNLYTATHYAMQVPTSALVVYEHLEKIEGWESKNLGVTAQAIQRSGHPYRYEEWMRQSGRVYATLTGSTVNCAQLAQSGMFTSQVMQINSASGDVVSLVGDSRFIGPPENAKTKNGVIQVSKVSVSVQGAYKFTVNTAVAGNVQLMLEHARADGINFGGWGWRSHERQIQLRAQNCVNIWDAPSSSCSPPTARPGKSQHEQGLAIDFTCGGSTIKNRYTKCFKWLSVNASKYGFKNLPSEPWHWSTTGR